MIDSFHAYWLETTSRGRNQSAFIACKSISFVLGGDDEFGHRFDVVSDRMMFLLQDDDRTMQFFKEERTDDAVYNVYLKKVQYHIDSNSSVFIWLLQSLSLLHKTKKMKRNEY